MERIFSILALVAAIGVGAYAYVTMDRQKGVVDALDEQVKGLSKTLGETQKAVTQQRQDFEALISALTGQAPQEPTPPLNLDMSKLTDEANIAYLAAYADQDGVTKRPSGLMYRVLRDGPAGGNSPKLGDKVAVKYAGALVDGTVFDQQPDPVVMPLVKLIEGWLEVLPLMKEGDEWEIAIPPNLAYGEEGSGSIPPRQALVFRIELVTVNP